MTVDDPEAFIRSHLDAFAKAFLPKNRRERLLLTVGDPGRLRMSDLIDHRLADQLIRSKAHDAPPAGVERRLKDDQPALLIPPDPWLNDDALIVSLRRALDAIEDHSFGSLVSIEPGTLAVYRGEGMDETIWLY